MSQEQVEFDFIFFSYQSFDNRQSLISAHLMSDDRMLPL